MKLQDIERKVDLLMTSTVFNNLTPENRDDTRRKLVSDWFAQAIRGIGPEETAPSSLTSLTESTGQQFRVANQHLGRMAGREDVTLDVLEDFLPTRIQTMLSNALKPVLGGDAARPPR